MTIQYQNKYLLPSPAGAWHCISATNPEPARQFLQQLMTFEESPHFDADTINKLLPDSNIQNIIAVPHSATQMVAGFRHPQKRTSG